MRRRDFARLVIGAVAAPAAWPMMGRAQQSKMPVIGFLAGASPKALERRLIPFRQALTEAGFVEGQNVRIEYRWSGDHYEQLPALAAELVRLPVSVVVAAGGAQTAIAARSATSSVPIVFQNGSDPVKMGWVASLARPGGNMTGVTNVSVETATKRIELMRELVPGTKAIGFLNNPRNPNSANIKRDLRAASRTLSREIVVVDFTSRDDLDSAFAMLQDKRVGALVTNADPVAYHWRDELIERAARHAIPTMFPNRDFVEAGGLASYGPTFKDVYRAVGSYTARILKGERPAELPVVQSTKYELIVNNRTAKALGLEVPLSVLMRIDAVID